ncbi:MAG: hypothetical protein R2864_11415 [Syntrophotaleaceae bacterium]
MPSSQAAAGAPLAGAAVGDFAGPAASASVDLSGGAWAGVAAAEPYRVQ